MFITLMFSQTVAEKLMEDQWIDSSETPVSLSDDDITSMCYLIIGLVAESVFLQGESNFSTGG